MQTGFQWLKLNNHEDLPTYHALLLLIQHGEDLKTTRADAAGIRIVGSQKIGSTIVAWAKILFIEGARLWDSGSRWSVVMFAAQLPGYEPLTARIDELELWSKH